MTVADTKLLRGLQAGSRSTCERFVSESYRAIYNLHRWLGADEDLGADLTQETFAAFWESLSRFEGRCSPQTWLRRIAIRAARRRLLKDAREAASAEELVLEAVPDGNPGPERIAIRHATLENVYEEVLRLDPPLREAFALRYRQEMRFAEIADALGIGLSLAKKRVYEARRRVLRGLQEREEEVA